MASIFQVDRGAKERMTVAFQVARRAMTEMASIKLVHHTVAFQVARGAKTEMASIKSAHPTATLQVARGAK